MHRESQYCHVPCENSVMEGNDRIPFSFHVVDVCNQAQHQKVAGCHGTVWNCSCYASRLNYTLHFLLQLDIMWQTISCGENKGTWTMLLQTEICLCSEIAASVKETVQDAAVIALCETSSTAPLLVHSCILKHISGTFGVRL